MRFEPGERHAVSSADGARILMLLSPWPGEGHFPAAESYGFFGLAALPGAVRQPVDPVRERDERDRVEDARSTTDAPRGTPDGITKTTRMKISAPQRPPRLSERRHDGGGGSRSVAGRASPPFFAAGAAFGFSGFFSRSSDGVDLDLVALLVVGDEARSRDGTSCSRRRRCFFVAMAAQPSARARGQADSGACRIPSSTSRASASWRAATARPRSRSCGGATSARSTSPSRRASSATRSATSR